MVKGLDNGISLDWFRKIIVEFFVKQKIHFLVLGVSFGIIFLKEVNKKIKFLGLSVLLILMYSFFASLKKGSGSNYFTEFLILTFLSVIVFIGAKNLFKNFEAKILLTVFVMFVTSIAVFDLGVTKIISLKENWFRYQKDKEVFNYFKQNNLLKPDELVLITPHNISFLNNFFYRQAIFPQQEIVTGYSYPLQTYDYKDFSYQIQIGRLKYVIMEKNNPYPLFMDYSFDDFKIEREINGYIILKNRNSN